MENFQERSEFYANPKKWIKQQTKDLLSTTKLGELVDKIYSFDLSKRQKKHYKKKLIAAYEANKEKDIANFQHTFNPKKGKQKRSRSLTKAAKKVLTPSEQKIKKYVYELNRLDEKRTAYYGTGSTMKELIDLNDKYGIKLFVHPRSRLRYPFSIHFGTAKFYTQIETAVCVKESTIRRRFYELKQKGYFSLLEDRHKERLSIWADGIFRLAWIFNKRTKIGRWSIVKDGFAPGIHTLPDGAFIRPKRRKIRRFIA